MSIEIYKVNKLFTIERVSVYVQMDGRIDEQMECFSRDVNRMQCGMGWSGGGWIGKGDGSGAKMLSWDWG